MLLEKLAAVIAASAMLMNGSMETALPDKNMDGTSFLANRQHAVSSSYVPELRPVSGPGQHQSMRPDAASALEEMFAAAKKDGLTLTIVSGYRSYSKQSTIYARKKANTGSAAKADALVARPGTSEHQLGLAMDLGSRKNSSLNSSFGKTEEGKWVYANCHRFGFIVRYPEHFEDVTGYSYEPWHVRYVGVPLATAIHESEVPMETFMSDYKLEVYDFLISLQGSEAEP